MGNPGRDGTAGRPVRAAATASRGGRWLPGWTAGRAAGGGSRPRLGTGPPGPRPCRMPGRAPAPAARPTPPRPGPGAGGAWARRCRVAGASALVVVGLLAARLGAPPGSSPLAAPRRGSEPGVVRVVARPGDSLWSLVARAAPRRDPRPLVDELARRRGGTELHPGDVVRVRP